MTTRKEASLNYLKKLIESFEQIPDNKDSTTIIEYLQEKIEGSIFQSNESNSLMQSNLNKIDKRIQILFAKATDAVMNLEAAIQEYWN